MKDPFEVLRAKEQQLRLVKEQIEALRVTAHLLGDEEEDDLLQELRVVGKAVNLP